MQLDEGHIEGLQPAIQLVKELANTGQLHPQQKFKSLIHHCSSSKFKKGNIFRVGLRRIENRLLNFRLFQLKMCLGHDSYVCTKLMHGCV